MSVISIFNVEQMFSTLLTLSIKTIADNVSRMQHQSRLLNKFKFAMLPKLYKAFLSDKKGNT